MSDRGRAIPIRGDPCGWTGRPIRTGRPSSLGDGHDPRGARPPPLRPRRGGAQYVENRLERAGYEPYRHEYEYEAWRAESPT
ncbi:hypothetical protein ABZ634_13335, partial [Nocardiopsis alba]